MPTRKNSLSDLITQHVPGVPSTCPLREAAALMARERASAALAMEDGQPVGIMTGSEVIEAVGARLPPDTPVSALMRRPIPTVAASASPVEAAALLYSADVGWLALTDDAGQHIGLIGERDLLRSLAANESDLQLPNEIDGRLRLMMEAVDDGLWDWNIVEDRFYLNPYSYKALGYEPNAFPITSATWKELIHPDDLPTMWGALEESVRSGRGLITEFRYRHADGDWRWVQGRGKVVAWDDAGRPTRMVGSHSDISDRKLMEEALRARETRYRSILAALSEGIVVQEAGGHIVACNPAAERILGLTFDQMRGRTSTDPRWGTIRPDGSPFPGEMLPSMVVLATGKSQRDAILGMHRPDGSLVWLSVNSEPLRRDGEDKPYAVATSFFDITDHYETEARLHRLSQAIEQSPVSIVITDASGIIEYVNPYFTETTGYSREEAIGQNPRILQAGKTSPDQYRQLWNTISAGGTWIGEFHNRCKNGALYWERAIIAPIREADGRITQYLAVKQNITEQKRLEDELRLRERYQRAVLDNFPFRVWLKDTESRFLAVNQPFADACGLTDTAALVGKTDFDILPPGLAENRRADDRAVLASRRKKVIEELAADRGGHRWFETYKAPVVGDDGVLLGTVGFARDITDRKKMEDQLRQSEAQYRQVVDNVKEVIFQTDVAGHWLFLNRAWQEITGFSISDSLGQNFLDYVHPDDRGRNTELFVALTTGQRDHCRCEARFLCADGGFRWIEVFARLAPETDGKTLGVAGTLADVTARKVAEAATQRALVEARRLAQARSDFLANMSHEIRTPLNVILGLVQAARQQRCDPVVRRYFEQIEDAGQLLLAVVNDILDFSKIEAGKLSLERAPFDLGRIIDQATMLVAPQAYGKGLTLELDEAADLPAVWSGDGFRLSQVLLNLLGNAVKFTERGRVVLSARRIRSPNDTDGIVLRIEDSGIGMTAEQLERLFQPFQQADNSTTRQFGGTGLGLAICKRLVDLMAGEIRVASQPGRGSVFEVRLPLRPVEGTTKIATVSWHSVALSGLTDTESQILSEALRERGFEMRDLSPAEVGAAANFDLIVLDGAALADHRVVAAAGAALDHGRRCVVVRTPGIDVTLPVSLRGRANLIERPLNARRLLAMGSLQPESGLPSPKAKRLAGLRILAVEDNPVNQMVLAELLNQEGVRVTLADHGNQALAHLAERGAAGFDLVLTDIQMPEMDGYETARRIRALAPGLPVIGLTAHAMPEERNRCLAAGMLDHVAKPINLDMLVAAIRRHTAAVSLVAATEIESLPTSPPVENPAATADIADSVVDWAALNRHFEGNKGLIDQLVALTLQTQAETAIQLRIAADRPDWEQIAAIAHGLKSLFGYFQPQRAFDLAKRTEQSARQQRLDAPQLARELAMALDELLAALALHRAVAAEHIPAAAANGDFATRLRDFADALQSRRMDAYHQAVFLQDRLPSDSRRPALEAAIRETLQLEFAAALTHLESALAPTRSRGR
ncbi:MAG TPA: PAS domain S-box protein [Candidatus Competibacter sp.]|nr:PAS domain S-box protein [Candidatus Competibacter sp.]